jgi:hypothetical protein
MDDFWSSTLFAATGLATRQAVRAAGMSGEAIDRMVRSGSWVAVRRGVYAARSYVDSRGTRDELQRLYDDAACLRISHPHVRSHESAAVVLEMPVLLPGPTTTHVTRRGVHGSRHEHGVKHHKAPFREEQVRLVDGVRVLDPARTSLDITREHGIVRGIVAMDSALRLGTRRSELWAAFEHMRCWPFSREIRAAIELCDPGSDSVAETLGRLLVARLGRGQPQTQFGLSCDGRTAFADLRIGRHLIEVDGRVKYLREDPSDRPPDETLWEEKKRQDWLCGFKLGMSRLTWADVYGAGEAAALIRLEREVSDTEARFGSDISDLAPYLVPRPPRRRPL